MAGEPTVPTGGSEFAPLDRVVRRRRTLRRYDPDRPVGEADLASVLDAGLRAPSAGHTQAVELLVLTTAADRDDYWRLTAAPDRQPDAWLRGMSAAPVLVLVWTSEAAYRERYAEPDKGWPRDSDQWSAPYWWVDAGMVVQTMLLTATALGLGSAFVGVPRSAQQRVAAAFGVPAEHSSVGLVTLGHPPGEYRPVRSRRATRARSTRIRRGRPR